MRYVKQEDGLGCGIACIAFVLKIKYKDAQGLFVDGKRRSKEEANFYCKEIVSILERRGLSYEYKYIKRRLKHKIYQRNIIVFIERSKNILLKVPALSERSESKCCGGGLYALTQPNNPASYFI